MTCKGNCKTAPGYYSKLVTIQKLKTTATVDASGHIDPTDSTNWETHTKAYAKVYTKGGREFYRAANIDAEASHMWEVASSSKVRAITPDMRLKWNDRYFNIVSVQDKDESRITAEIVTKEDV